MMVASVNGYDLMIPIIYGQKIIDINSLLKKVAGVELTGVLLSGVWQTRVITVKKQNLEDLK